jgi:hypothetical protein
MDVRSIGNFMDKSLEKAKIELETIESKWHLRCSIMENDEKRQLSPEQVQRERQDLKSDFDRIRLYYTRAFSDHDFDLLADGIFNHLRHDLNISIQKGEQNYRDMEHNKKMEKIRTWGEFLNDIKFNIVSFVTGIIVALGYFFIRP